MREAPSLGRLAGKMPGQSGQKARAPPGLANQALGRDAQIVLRHGDREQRIPRPGDSLSDGGKRLSAFADNGHLRTSRGSCSLAL
jgi:hypothetical protein